MCGKKLVLRCPDYSFPFPTYHPMEGYRLRSKEHLSNSRRRRCDAMRIALIGPPGAGKSTQAKRVARSLPFHNHSPRFSSGEIVRAEIEAGTDLGREMEGYYARGERLPDRTILPLLLPRLRRSMGFMLDNFPQPLPRPEPWTRICLGAGLGA
jgi:hypothetical protein